MHICLISADGLWQFCLYGFIYTGYVQSRQRCKCTLFWLGHITHHMDCNAVNTRTLTHKMNICILLLFHSMVAFYIPFCFIGFHLTLDNVRVFFFHFKARHKRHGICWKKLLLFQLKCDKRRKVRKCCINGTPW